ncbi:MAG: DNA polymerase [Clostridia bacterium]|nr:DNA polymerase [Clostridia bacterium]
MEVITIQSKRHLHIDLETFSSEPLPKCGVYRYSSSPDFEILLLSYAFDDEPVEIVDMACGEAIPERVLMALENPEVLKYGHHSAFERVCLSQYFGHWLDLHQWRCSMVMAAYLTLPMRLADVAMALKLTQQKMEEGRELIRYFSVPCKPTKANGGRTRNLPEHAPEKWALYKKYNMQDVETERAVVKALEQYPLPEHEWELYALDQTINDRGVRIDKALVKSAIAVDSAFSARAYQKAQEITGLDNPGSVSQLKAWLADQDVPMESLAKKLVKEKAAETDGIVSELLNLRLELSKTSVKKYEAMARSVCKDGRVRGTLQFYGANRTGRWCLTGDHEILTNEGWKRLDEWEGGKIACWNSGTEVVSFQYADAVSFDYSGLMYRYLDKRIDQFSTPDHKMRYYRSSRNEWTTGTVEEMAKIRPCIPIYGYRTQQADSRAKQLRVLVMVQADGRITDDGILVLQFKKLRKVERCKRLLRETEIEFKYSQYDCVHRFTIPSRKIPLWLRMFADKKFGSWLFDENADVFFDELAFWDGYRPAPNSIQYCTCVKENADMIQAFAHMSGKTAIIVEKNLAKEHPGWGHAYYVDICESLQNRHEIRNKPTVEEFSGKVYCASTSTGFFLVRRNGKVWVTGNSGRLVQLQNVPQNHLPDLDLAREIVKRGDTDIIEMLYGSVPNTLSELIRTAFIPRDGCRFIVADFSAIEARVLAWLAGEEWVLEEFRGAGKIYEETASRMYHIPKETVVKGNPNYEYRQKGKQATLSCGYAGGVGALKAMGAKMPEEEMQPLVDAWRAANPHIVAFWGAMERAARSVIRNQTSARVGKVRLFWKDDKLFMRLPSGRDLCYQSPHFTVNRFGNDAIGYYAPSAAGKMVEQETFGGKLVENATQAIARDLLAHAMENLEAAGYPIVFDVHDECVMEVPLDFGSVEEACAIMGQGPDWAEGLPLRADGYECSSYRKM